MNLEKISLLRALILLSVILFSACEEDSILNIPEPNSSAKIYVDSNSESFEFGSEEFPFKDINKAMSVATEGTFIIVASGEYEVPNGKLYLKAGVGIKGESSYSTIINGDLIDQNNSSLPLYINNITFNDLNFNRPIFSSNKFTEFEISDNKCNSINVRFDSKSPATQYTFNIKNNDVAEKIHLHHGDGLSNSLNYIEKNRVSGGIYLENGKKSITYVDSNYVEGIIKNTSGAETESYLRFNFVRGRIIDSCEYWTDWASNIIYKNKILLIQYLPETNLAAIQHFGASVGILDNQITVQNGSAIDLVAHEYVGLERNIINVERTFPNTDSSNVYYGMNIISKKCEIADNIINGGDYGIYLSSTSSFIFRNQIRAERGMYLNCNGDFIENILIANEDALIVDGASGKYSGNEFNGNNCSVRIVKAKNLFSNSIIDFGGGLLGSTGGNVFKSENSFNMIVESNYTDVESIYAKFNKWNHQTEPEIDQFDIYDGKDQSGLSIINFVPFIEH